MVRIWASVPCRRLKDQWLLGEHRELHVIVGAAIKRLHKKKGGWVNHSETIRWVHKLGWLKQRHAEEVHEFKKRGWPSGLEHKTPIDLGRAPKSALGMSHRPTRKEREKDLHDLRERNGIVGTKS